MAVREWDAPIRELSDQDVAWSARTERQHPTALTHRDVVRVGPLGEHGLLDRLYASNWLYARLEPLMHLEANWDTYGGRPLSQQVASAADSLLVPLLIQGVPPPSFVPTSDGGLGLEWHQPDLEFVIHLTAASDPIAEATVFFYDNLTGEEVEDRLMDGLPWLPLAFSRLGNVHP